MTKEYEPVLTTVDGLERFALNYRPNGIECDGCGLVLNMERRTYRQELDEFRANGWTINSTWHGQQVKDYCPSCAQTGQDSQ